VAAVVIKDKKLVQRQQLLTKLTMRLCRKIDSIIYGRHRRRREDDQLSSTKVDVIMERSAYRIMAHILAPVLSIISM